MLRGPVAAHKGVRDLGQGIRGGAFRRFAQGPAKERRPKASTKKESVLSGPRSFASVFEAGTSRAATVFVPDCLRCRVRPVFPDGQAEYAQRKADHRQHGDNDAPLDQGAAEDGGGASAFLPQARTATPKRKEAAFRETGDAPFSLILPPSKTPAYRPPKGGKRLDRHKDCRIISCRENDFR